MINYLQGLLRRYYPVLFIGILVAVHSFAGAAGKVYLVLGSDTAIWTGMNVNRHDNTYDLSLYTDPNRNAYQVMDPLFRQQYVDSYGNPVKLTWWMMGGNIFRYATNLNVPLANTMTLYLMNKYHGANIIGNGDELSLHYHTFKWTDYNQDGMFFWNQALNFTECLSDWDYTLATYLLEENVFPVSFRSGWHYMDNAWQAAINQLFPFSMHNDYPNVRTDNTEPLDNTYDWSQAPSSFIPYQPAVVNYQLPGGDRGWNVRSAHFWRVPAMDLMDTLFYQASLGNDQVACLWGHLPEGDFLTNIGLIDSLAHQAEADYPGVEFRYCTAIEAMQLWMGSADSIGPEIVISEQSQGNSVNFTIAVSEPLYQPAPFVAVKDIYEQYHLYTCMESGENLWQTNESIDPDLIAKVAVAAIDTAGNLTTEFINYRADDIYLDDEENGFSQLEGDWSGTTDAAWGTQARITYLDYGESAAVRWQPQIEQTGLYNIFIQVPEIGVNHPKLTYIINASGITDTVTFDQYPTLADWFYLGTTQLVSGGDNYIDLTAVGSDSINQQTLLADVIRFSALVRDRDINVADNLVDFGIISAGDTARQELEIQNLGINPLTISNIVADLPEVTVNAEFPLSVNGMGSIYVPIEMYTDILGYLEGLLTISSDDGNTPEYEIQLQAVVEPYFQIVDNEDTCCYEESGDWHYSVAQAWGNSSRYAYLGNNASARFRTELSYAGNYAIYEIVPTTVNSTDRAVYSIMIDGATIGTVNINQNSNSGGWVHIGDYELPAGQEVIVQVKDEGQYTSGPVIRADAIKFSLLYSADVESGNPLLPVTYKLEQNFPNPFNSTTTIRYYLPVESSLVLKIYNIRGRLVYKSRSQNHQSGWGEFKWNGVSNAGRPVGTGVYLYRLTIQNPIAKNIDTKKMILVE